ncbi:hypothetical protein CEXT_15421 [Caerostris extrusa]|uniref:Uncharacterized protein n=1 Tax=Caerostris extrusa TaxID=172846 RepID=A0AAV4VDI3_CAEEX|nr:hypothetical protein CEXT_15421 [Caerostris extrusa]
MAGPLALCMDCERSGGNLELLPFKTILSVTKYLEKEERKPHCKISRSFDYFRQKNKLMAMRTILSFYGITPNPETAPPKTNPIRPSRKQAAETSENTAIKRRFRHFLQRFL